MNRAFQFLLAWYLTNRGIPEADARDIMLLIHEGIGEKDADSRRLLDGLVSEAEKLAKSTANETMLEMADLGRQIDANENALEKTQTLIAMRKIIDLPPANPLADRIRQFKLKEFAATLA